MRQPCKVWSYSGIPAAKRSGRWEMSQSLAVARAAETVVITKLDIMLPEARSFSLSFYTLRLAFYSQIEISSCRSVSSPASLTTATV